ERLGPFLEQLPADDATSVESPDLRPVAVDGCAAALATHPLVDGDDNARSGLNDLLGVEPVVLPRAPVVAGRPDHCIAPDVERVEIQNGICPQIPDDVLVEHGPEGLNVLDPSPNHLDIRLRHHLLREPGGFEGFPRIQVAPDPNRLPVLSSDQPGQWRVDLDPTCGAMRMHPTEREQFISEVPELRGLETKIVESFEQVLKPLPHLLPSPKHQYLASSSRREAAPADAQDAF